jgi:hypothetical protein
VIIDVMRVSSYDSFLKGIQDLKPAVKQTIKPILDGCKKRSGATDESPFEAAAEEPVPQ